MKSLEKLTDKTYLASLLNNREALFEDIEQTTGYVLHLMEKEKFFPPLEWFMNDGQEVNTYALSFIINNYDLNKSQLHSLRKYFSSYGDNIVANEMMEEDVVKENLISGKEITRKTVLNLKFIQEHEEQILAYKQDNDSGYSEIDSVLANSAKTLTPEEIFSLPIKIRRVFRQAIFNSVPEYFQDRAFARKYKEMLMKSNFSRMRLEVFSNYIMDPEEDKDLLEKMLQELPNSIWDRGYNDWMEIKGMDKILDPMRFIEERSCNSIKMLSNATILANKERLQELLRTKFFERQEFDKEHQLNILMKLDASVEQFSLLVDLDFVRDFVEKYPHNNWLKTSHMDYDGVRDKQEYMNNILLRLIAENKKFVYLLSAYDLDRIFIEELKNARHRFKAQAPDIGEVLLKAYTNIVEVILETKNMVGSHASIRGREIAAMTLGEEFVDILIDKACPNLLYALAAEYASERDSKNNYHKDTQQIIINIIDKIAARVDKKRVKEIAKHFNIKFKLPLLAMHDKVSNKDNDLLSYNLDEALDEKHYKTLFFFHPEYQKQVLKEGKILPQEVIQGVFNEAENSKQFKTFFIQYTEKHRDTLLEDKDFTNMILSSTYGQDLFKIEIKQSEQINLVSQVMELVAQQEAISEKQNEASNIFEQNPRNRRLDFYNTSEYKAFQKEKAALGKQQEELKALLSSEILEEMAMDYLRNKNYTAFSDFKSIFHLNRNVFAQYVSELSASEVLKALDNEAFKSALKNSVSYEGNSEIKWQFSDNEALEVSKKLYQEKIFIGKSLFVFYPTEQKKRIVKEFLINTAPYEAIYSYDFLPNDKTGVTSYTNEELLKIFQNLDKDKGIIYAKDSNAHHRLENIIGDNFKDNEKAYLEFVEFVKTEPIVYMVASYHNNFSEYVRKNEAYKGMNLDESQSAYLKEHFDFDIILKGVEQLLDNIERKKDIISDEMYSSLEKQTTAAIDKVIWATIYDIENYQTGEKKYFSNITKEQTDKCLTILMEKAPFYLMSLSRLGVYDNLPKQLNEHTIDYQSNNLKAHDFVYPSSRVSGDSFRIDGNSWAGRNIGYSIEGFVNALINEDKFHELNYLAFLTQQHKFEQNEIDYEYRKMPYSPIIEFIAQDNKEKESYFALNEKLEACSRKFFMDRVLERKEQAPIKKRSNKI